MEITLQLRVVSLGMLLHTESRKIKLELLTFNREAIEDLTGGVTSEILSTNILDKDKFWKEELMNVNKQFLFGCATGIFSNWLDPKYRGPPRERKGISEGHSYSIMEAKEINGVRLLRLR
jgi:hypothetical protein